MAVDEEPPTAPRRPWRQSAGEEEPPSGPRRTSRGGLNRGVSWSTQMAEYASAHSSDLSSDSEKGSTPSESGPTVTNLWSTRSQSSLETTLRSAGIHVEHSSFSSQSSSLPATPVTAESSMVQSLGDMGDVAEQPSLRGEWDQELLRRFFAGNAQCVSMSTAHESLDAVVRNVFSLMEDCGDLDSLLCSSESPRTPGTPPERRTRVRRLVEGRGFQLFFELLTVYLILGPTLADMLGNAKTDELFLYVDTSIFGLLFMEFILLVLGHGFAYLLTLVALLDFVALASLAGHTWFLAGAQGASEVTRVARSARIVRLLRLGKVARAGRLLPRLMHVMRRQQFNLAKSILLKKLWRIFLILDADCDGYVALFDIKAFYFVMLQECEHMLCDGRQELFRADLAVFESVAAGSGDLEGQGNLNFEEFSKMFLSTRGGDSIMQFFARDMVEGSTLWKLTHSLSDAAAFQVCFIVLVISVVTSMLKVEELDRSAETGLRHLTFLLGREHGASGICEHLEIFRERHRVLLVFLEGLTYFHAGRCFSPGLPLSELDPFSPLGEASELLRVCLSPSGDCSSGGVVSMAVLDRGGEALRQGLYAILVIVALIAIMVLFVLALESDVQGFRCSIIYPLRELADEMTSMSVLEILTMEQDLLCPVPEVKTHLQEVTELRAALEAMRTAIRSWSLYVPPCVVERLLNRGMEAKIGVARCTTSILFCDICRFEEVCKHMEPQSLLTLLSVVLGQIAEVIEDRRGTLLEFIGDEILAVFNTPNPIKHHVYAAVAAAVDIQKLVDGLPAIALESGEEIPVQCRVGVHTGSVYVGNLGSQLRMKYGMLGDGVNLAARLKMLNSRYGTRSLVSAAVVQEHKSFHSLFLCRPVDIVAVKGKRHPTTVYEVLGDVQSSSACLHEAVALHTFAFSLYREQEFAHAAITFSRAAAAFADAGLRETVSWQMRRRCLRFLAQPPARDWDGVERLQVKSWEETVEDELDSIRVSLDFVEPPHESRVSSAHPLTVPLGEAW